MQISGLSGPLGAWEASRSQLGPHGATPSLLKAAGDSQGLGRESAAVIGCSCHFRGQSHTAAVPYHVDVAPGMKAGVMADLGDKSLDSKVHVHRMSLEAQILLTGC